MEINDILTVIDRLKASLKHHNKLDESDRTYYEHELAMLRDLVLTYSKNHGESDYSIDPGKPGGQKP